MNVIVQEKKIDQKHPTTSILLPKKPGKGVKLRVHINTVSGHCNIDNWRRGGMDEMVLAAPRLSKGTEHSSRCHSNAKLHSAAQSLHIFLQ